MSCFYKWCIKIVSNRIDFLIINRLSKPFFKVFIGQKNGQKQIEFMPHAFLTIILGQKLYQVLLDEKLFSLNIMSIFVIPSIFLIINIFSILES